jgi:hypothetical protein
MKMEKKICQQSMMKKLAVEMVKMTHQKARGKDEILTGMIKARTQ